MTSAEQPLKRSTKRLKYGYTVQSVIKKKYKAQVKAMIGTGMKPGSPRYLARFATALTKFIKKLPPSELQ